MTGFIQKEWRVPAVSLVCIALVLCVTLIIGQINEARHLGSFDTDRTDNVAVVLAFEPERFHIGAFQEVGRYQGWSDGRAVIMAVDIAELRRLARNYWVGSIEPFEATR